MYERRNVPACDECEALDDAPVEEVEREFCSICPWGREPECKITVWLIEYSQLQAAGCPIGRHELTNDQWRWLGIVKGELERLAAESAKEKAKNGSNTGAT